MKRMDRYREVIGQMLEQGTAYYCYCTRRKWKPCASASVRAGEKPRYDGTWRPEPGKDLAGDP